MTKQNTQNHLRTLKHQNFRFKPLFHSSLNNCTPSTKKSLRSPKNRQIRIFSTIIYPHKKPPTNFGSNFSKNFPPSQNPKNNFPKFFPTLLFRLDFLKLSLPPPDLPLQPATTVGSDRRATAAVGRAGAGRPFLRAFSCRVYEVTKQKNKKQ